MGVRTAASWTIALAMGIVAISAFLLARAVATIGAAVLGELLAGIASYVYLMALIEIANSAIVWATQGPILALAWVAARIAAWRGG